VIATDISERTRYIHAINEQNEKLREIAWTQSHIVRAPLARMIGLINLLHNPSLPEDVSPDGILNFILASAHELDGIIKEIVRKTEQVKHQPKLDGPLVGRIKK
jgi:hypothetical protein